MATLYSFGSVLVSRDEMVEKTATSGLPSFLKESRTDRSATLEFSAGTVRASEMPAAVEDPTGETVPWQEVGPGKPLTVMLRHVYTGAHRNERDLLVSTSVKAIHTFGAQPRAVNILKRSVREKSDIRSVLPSEEGTRLVYYSPGVVDRTTVLGLEIAIDRFKSEIFDQVSGFLKSAASIPVFGAANLFLLAGSVVAKLVGRVGERIFDGVPHFREPFEINLGEPGQPIPHPGYAVVVPDEHERAFREGYRLDDDGRLVSRGDGTRYDHSAPYITISLDGTQRDELKGFKATSASAGQLEKFYNLKENGETDAGILLDSLKLYNDFTYRKRAMAEKGRLDQLSPDSPEYAVSKARYDALISNILTDVFKLGQEGDA